MKCYVEDLYGVILFQFIREGKEISIWRMDDLLDNIDGMEEFIKDFGDDYFETLEDYKKGNSKSLKKWWKTK